MSNYEFVKSQPVAKFFYKGDHTHPVRRTVLIVQQSDTLLTGYELREGSEVRDFKNAPVKSYRKDRIARICEIDLRRKLRKSTDQVQLKRSTLTRYPLRDLIYTGP